jgi:murein DD-endopeptidase MepM/ murein hydrolase activator NlpD
MDFRFSKIATLLALSLFPLLAACATDDTPKTHLSWDVNDRVTTKRAPVRTAAASPRTYVYQDALEDIAAPPVPTPRPAYRPATTTRTAQVYEYRDEYRAPAQARPVSAPANATFAWPVNGQVISGFGVARNGERNDGINIAARHNTPIRAAAAGTISYSGSLSGYGNLVLIKHANGYVTAYAHSDRVLVTQGDFVAKGQVIGYAGQTGDVSSPQLHFEIRNGTTPVNPERYLAPRAGA